MVVLLTQARVFLVLNQIVEKVDSIGLMDGKNIIGQNNRIRKQVAKEWQI